jgi:hypothetical protein
VTAALPQKLILRDGLGDDRFHPPALLAGQILLPDLEALFASSQERPAPRKPPRQ